jgi:hypothetical protein
VGAYTSSERQLSRPYSITFEELLSKCTILPRFLETTGLNKLNKLGFHKTQFEFFSLDASKPESSDVPALLPGGLEQHGVQVSSPEAGPDGAAGVGHLRRQDCLHRERDQRASCK